MNYFPKLHKKIISLCFLRKSKVHTDTARLPSLLLPFRVMMSIVSPWINCTMYLFDRFITKVNFKGIWKGYAFKVDLCYKKALDECRYRYTLHYEPPTTNKRKKQPTEQHTLVQPPIQQKHQHQYRTQFLALVDKHVPKDHKLRKIFNRNTIKISYSCMNNTKQIIDNHNKRILNSSKHIKDTAANTKRHQNLQLPTEENIST